MEKRSNEKQQPSIEYKKLAAAIAADFHGIISDSSLDSEAKNSAIHDLINRPVPELGSGRRLEERKALYTAACIDAMTHTAKTDKGTYPSKAANTLSHHLAKQGVPYQKTIEIASSLQSKIEAKTPDAGNSIQMLASIVESSNATIELMGRHEETQRQMKADVRHEQAQAAMDHFHDRSKQIAESAIGVMKYAGPKAIAVAGVVGVSMTIAAPAANAASGQVQTDQVYETEDILQNLFNKFKDEQVAAPDAKETTAQPEEEVAMPDQEVTPDFGQKSNIPPKPNREPAVSSWAKKYTDRAEKDAKREHKSSETTKDNSHKSNTELFDKVTPFFGVVDNDESKSEDAQSNNSSEKSDKADEQPAPVEEKTDPVTDKADKVEKKTDPVPEKSDKADEQPAPVEEKTDPVTDKADEQPAPVEEKTDPVTDKADKVEKKTDPVPEKSDKADKKENPVKNETDSTDNDSDPVIEVPTVIAVPDAPAPLKTPAKIDVTPIFQQLDSSEEQSVQPVFAAPNQQQAVELAPQFGGTDTVAAPNLQSVPELLPYFGDSTNEENPPEDSDDTMPGGVPSVDTQVPGTMSPDVIEVPGAETNNVIEVPDYDNVIEVPGMGDWKPKDMANGKNLLQEIKDKYGASNSGELAAGELVYVDPEIWGAHSLYPDAATGMRALNEAYEAEFGENIQFTDSYRSLDIQKSLKKEKPYLAATPGLSNHGWGFAVDFASNINSFGTKQHKWMQANAGRFGWVNPEWAQQFDQNGVKNKQEAWHFEWIGIDAVGYKYANNSLADREAIAEAKAKAEAKVAREKATSERQAKQQREHRGDQASEKYTGNADLRAAKEMADKPGKDGVAGKVMVYLLTHTNLTPTQIVGMAGNFDAESGMDSNKPQNGGTAFGLAQWDGSRKNALRAYAAKHGEYWGNFDLQMKFLVHELKGPESRAYGKIRQTNSAKGAALVTRVYFERPGKPHDARRIKAAQRYDRAFKQIKNGNKASGARNNASPASHKKDKLQTQLGKMADSLNVNQTWGDAVEPMAKSYPITSGVGYRGSNYHRGVDYGVPSGTPFHSMFDGVVTTTTVNTNTRACNNLLKNLGKNPRNRDAMQKNVYVSSKVNGQMITTYYGHLSKFKVKNGEIVKAGDVIGLSGSTGCSTGPHAHIEASGIKMPGNKMTSGNVVGRINNALGKFKPGRPSGDVVKDIKGRIKHSHNVSSTAGEITPIERTTYVEELGLFEPELASITAEAPKRGIEGPTPGNGWLQVKQPKVMPAEPSSVENALQNERSSESDIDVDQLYAKLREKTDRENAAALQLFENFGRAPSS